MMQDSELRSFKEVQEELKVVFDVGARDDLDFLELLPRAEYHLFEPQFGSATALANRTSHLNNVKVNQFGLADRVEKAVVYYSNVQSFEKHPFIASIEGDCYDLDTVDNYCQENGIERIDFLKIDTEGFDYKVLLGAKQMIQSGNIKYIQFEYWDGVRKFYDMLNSMYDMWFINADISKNQDLDEECIIMIDTQRIPGGNGGDVFCKLKQN
jgi:FkbM family methyltransferase